MLDAAETAIRANYSTPPSHGALLVSTIPGDPAMHAAWTSELDGMRARIKRMRQGLVARLASSKAHDCNHFLQQRGLFSYSGLDAARMGRLKSEFGIYGVSDGRLCMAAPTERTLDRGIDGSRAVSQRLQRSVSTTVWVSAPCAIHTSTHR